MNYLKPNPKSHDQMYITFQIRQYFAQQQDHPKKENVQDRRDFELAKAQVTQTAFIFFESKICFALKNTALE